MAYLDETAYESKYNNSSTGKYKAGQNRGIGSDDHRDMITDNKDSLMFKSTFLGTSSGAVMIWGGLWDGVTIPTSTKQGTLYISTADHGSPGDADYIPSGAWIISNVDGADAFSEYYIKP